MSKRSIIVGIAFASIALVACVDQSPADGTNNTNNTISASEDLISTNAGPPGNWCHVNPDVGGGLASGVYNGVVTAGGWCCGTATCVDQDPKVCTYGQTISVCASCGFYNCISGPQDVNGGSLKYTGVITANPEQTWSCTQPTDPNLSIPMEHQ
ncbi:MAG TPA: hypothetical protein VGL61_21520 [Kofleriaceae bacterium]